ncbi:unnamed protein product, partial [Musa hybrid cultivar]
MAQHDQFLLESMEHFGVVLAHVMLLVEGRRVRMEVGALDGHPIRPQRDDVTRDDVGFYQQHAREHREDYCRAKGGHGMRRRRSSRCARRRNKGQRTDGRTEEGM